MSTSKIYIREGQESVGAILVEIITGLQSAFTYSGALGCEAFTQNAEIGVQTAGGYFEGTPRETG